MTISTKDQLCPSFAVVGHPNKGKSSIVATLAQDDSVYIDRVSGSTTAARDYPMSVNGEVLYHLIDTPGFQRARAVLAWLQQHCDDSSRRPQTVAQFCEAHANDLRYHNEIQLLQPILAGAGIIYVVDGSRPFGPEYEAEMEILRWTGQPSLAIINPIEGENYLAEWETALGQYFKTVRVFNAHRAEFIKRTDLLSVFGQLLPKWQGAIDKAVQTLKAERLHQHRQAGELIATLLVDCIQHRESRRIPGEKLEKSLQQALLEQYQFKLRQMENQCRTQVQEAYQYFRLKRQEDSLQFEEDDLFDQQSWYLSGLSKTQLLAVATGAGAGAGALIDVGLAGHSLLLGSAVGGLSGGIGAWLFSKQIAKLTIKGLPTGGIEVFVGPANNPNFAFVLLGRALNHLQLLCTRTHAVRTEIQLQGENNNSKALDAFTVGEKTRLMKLFKDIRNNKKTLQHRSELADLIVDYTKNLDGNI